MVEEKCWGGLAVDDETRSQNVDNYKIDWRVYGVSSVCLNIFILKHILKIIIRFPTRGIFKSYLPWDWE